MVFYYRESRLFWLFLMAVFLAIFLVVDSSMDTLHWLSFVGANEGGDFDFSTN